MFAQGHYRETLFLQGFWYPNLLSRKEGRWITGMEELPPAYFRLALTLPSEEIPVSSIAWEKKKEHPNGTTTYYGQGGPIPLLALASSKNYLMREIKTEGVDIKSYFFSRDSRTADACLEYAAEAIRFIKYKYGLPLTFDHLSIIDLYMGSTAAYASGNTIFIPRELHKFPNLLKRLVESIVVHEISHLWWGVGLTYNFDKDNWIGEGLASYVSLAYFEEKYGREENTFTWPKWLPNMDFGEYFTELPYREIAVRDWDRPITESARTTKDQSSLSITQYNKGTMIHRMLHYVLGEQKYAAFLQALIKQYFAKVVTTQQMVDLCQEVTGQDLTWFFDQWIYDTKKLDYALGKISSHKSSNAIITSIQIIRKQDAVMPVELQVIFQDNTKQSIQMEGKQKQEIITLESKAEIKEAHLDPGHILPDINRSNNHYHHKIRFYPLFEFPDSDSYLITAIPYTSYNPTDKALSGVTVMAGYLTDWNLSLSAFYKEEPQRLGFQSLLLKDRLFSPGLAGIISFSDIQGLRGGSAGLRLTLYEFHQQIRLPANLFTLSCNYQDAYYLSDEEKRKAEEEKTISEGKIGSITLMYTRDARLTPLKGLHVQGTIELGSPDMGGDYDFRQYQFDGKYYFHIHHLSSLMFRSFLGKTQGELPLQKKFSLAGPLMLRGYNFDADYLGSHLATFTVELNMPIHKRFRNDVSIKKYFWFNGVNSAFYYDGGKVWDKPEKFSKAKYYHSLGTSLILKTSIMNLIPVDWRFDLAFPLDHDPERENHATAWFQIVSSF